MGGRLGNLDSEFCHCFPKNYPLWVTAISESGYLQLKDKGNINFQNEQIISHVPKFSSLSFSFCSASSSYFEAGNSNKEVDRA